MRKVTAFGAALVAFTASWLVVAGPAAAAADLLSTVRVSVASSLASPSPMAGPVEYDPSNVTSVGGYARTDELSIAVAGGTANRSFSLDLQAPTGAAFATGSYYGDDVDGVRGYGTLGEGGSSCPDVRFTIVDIASSGTAITRLDVRFQTTCNTNYSNDNATIFGELQLGEPSAAPNVTTGARSFSWPNVPVGTRSPAVLPLWFRNSGTTALAVGTATRSGAASGDFPVLSDGCSGRTLAAHASCSVVLAFAPRAAGPRSATLTVPIGGRNVATAVAGTGPAGRTLLRINSQPGDYVGGGKSYLITDAQARMQVSTQGPNTVTATTQNARSAWSVTIDDRIGPLAVGTYQTADDAFDGVRLLVTGEGRGCGSSTGTVTVTQVSFDADHAPIAFDASFTQTCRFSTGASLTGEIAYRATTTPVAATGPFVLHSGQALAAGSAVTNGAATTSYKLAVTTAGRAQVTDSAGKVLWATPATAVAAKDRLAVKTAGNLALVTSAGSVLWTTVSSGTAGNLLVLQSDGNLVLYNSGYRPVWASRTLQPV